MTSVLRWGLIKRDTGQKFHFRDLPLQHQKQVKNKTHRSGNRADALGEVLFLFLMAAGLF
jgi:hypothetical protein